MFKFKPLCTALLSAAALSVSGCANLAENQYFNQENIGTAVGVIAGAALGSKVGSGSGRTAAMLVGALAGGALGKTIGARLDTRDREALAMKTQQLLEQDLNQPVVWTSDHSDAKAVITPVSTTTQTKNVQVKRTAKVQPVPNMTLLNQTYYAHKSANVRNAPSTQADKVGGLQPGSSFTALGRTDNDWIMVGRKGVSIGYVYAPLVSSKPLTNKPASSPSAVVATDLDAMPDTLAKQQGFDLDSIETGTVSATSACKTLEYRITTKGNTESQQVQACQANDGAWELI